MSGGSYDYAEWKIRDFADSLQLKNDPRRIAFQKLLVLVAEATHDIEWVDSCDYGPGDEYAAIDKVFSFLQADPSTIAKAQAYDAFREMVSKFLKDN